MKSKINLTFIISIAVLILLVASCTTEKANWPQFLGPESNMIAKGENLPEVWNDSLNVKWTHPLTGAGWSSPIVYGDKIFITSAVLKQKAPEVEQPQQTQPVQQAQTNNKTGQQAPPPPPPAEDSSYMKEVWSWELTCIDLNTGAELWKQVAHTGNPKIKKHAGSTYASETPVTDGKYVYAYFGMTGIFCYDLTGKLIWEKELGAFKTLNGWGTGSSPVLYQNMVYIQCDNEENSFLIALDAATGDEKWKVTRDEKTTYSTPVIWKNSNRIELVTTGKTARSYDPTTGKLLWQLKMGGEMSIPSPVYDNENIYLGNAGSRDKKGVFYAVNAGAEGDVTPADSGLVSEGVKWTIREAGISNPSPLLYNGHLYLLSGRGGELQCIDAATGTQVYKEKIDKVVACWASPWIQNNKVYFFDEKGITQVIQAGSQFKVLSQNFLKDKFWSSVAITDDAYIFKGVEKLFCVKK